ncbi:MAG: DsbA family protein [Alphaproteobacteria bacterium]
MTKTLLLFSAAFLAIAPVKAAEFNDTQKGEIEGIVKAYLMENPDVIFDSIEAYKAKQAEEEASKAQNAIKDNLAAMTAEDAPSIGASAADADVTVIEFFDYNCGYCKRAIPDIQSVVKDDAKVRFVFKEMPILGPTSRVAASWALAAHKQGKYFDYHVAIMEHRGPKNEEELSKLAEKLGLDADKMKEDANSEEIKKELEEDIAFAREIGINGTPAFIIGGKLYGGYLGKDGLKATIKETREK